MTLYRIGYGQMAWTTVEVEAASEDEALDKGYDLLPSSLCHQCASDYDLSGDWDADYENIENLTEREDWS